MTDLDELIHAEVERTLDAHEAHAYLSAPVTDEERVAVLDLCRWFTTRYPEPRDRLAYARQAYERWRSAPRARPQANFDDGPPDATPVNKI